MLVQIVWRSRRTEAFEIDGRRGGNPTDVRRQPLRDHVFRHGAAIADTGVETARDDIDQAVAHTDVDLDLWIAVDEDRHDRVEQKRDRILQNVDPDAAHRRIPEPVEVLRRVANDLQWTFD